MIGAATCCYVRAGLGGDSVAVFFDGLSRFAGISLGTASWIFNILLLAIGSLTARRYIAWTTVFSCILTGWFVDLADWALAPVLTFDGGVLYRWALFFTGLVLLAAGCGLMIRRCPGMSVLDAIVTRLAERCGRSYRMIRIWVDVAVMAAGVAMGGIIGAGSIVAAFATGPAIAFFSKKR